MRLLFLTNFYPPASRGGYELWCQEVAEGLRRRGHEVVVLTSTHGRATLPTPDPAWVCRDLHLEMELASLRNAFQFFTSRKAREQENLARLRQIVDNVAPEGILIWGLWNLPRSLAALAETLRPGRVAYYMGDYWPTLPNQFENYWQAPPRNWVTGLPKALLKPVAVHILAGEAQPALRFEHIFFPTAFMREAFEQKGVPLQKTTIIYGGIDTTPYRSGNGTSQAEQSGLSSLLYIGRLSPDKGVHTAIEALGELVHRRGVTQVKLTIVGSGEADYEARLRQLVRQEQLASLVTFLGAQPKEAMPALYRQADIFLFTSIWPEPFGRVLVEAMASGVAVVGTATGGAAEILIENENSLLFTPGDASSLAAQLARLIESPPLRWQLSTAGRQTALTKFDLSRMTAEIEAALRTIVT